MLEQDVRIDEDHSALAACQGHDFIRADAVAGVAVESSEPVRPRLLLDLQQDATAVLAALKVDNAPGPIPRSSRMSGTRSAARPDISSAPRLHRTPRKIFEL